jgi:hypoxanthine phosphoribosyltransferase
VKLAPLFSEEQIRERVEALASDIAAAPLKPDVALPILSGSFVFAADLLRALARRELILPMEFIWLRSYGAMRQRGEIAVLMGPPDSLIDGVLDGGQTLAKARDLLLERGAATVLTAVAVDKSRPDAVLTADYAVFTGVADFIVGYGMDDAGEGRGLPYIARML